MIKVHLNDTADEENMKLFIQGLQIVFNQFDDRIGMDDAAHAMISVSANMLRHIMDHSMPGLSTEKLNTELRDQVNRMLTSMEEEVWNQEQQ
jgi:hypothetical protein